MVSITSRGISNLEDKCFVCRMFSTAKTAESQLFQVSRLVLCAKPLPTPSLVRAGIAAACSRLLACSKLGCTGQCPTFRESDQVGRVMVSSFLSQHCKDARRRLRASRLRLVGSNPSVCGFEAQQIPKSASRFPRKGVLELGGLRGVFLLR